MIAASNAKRLPSLSNSCAFTKKALARMISKRSSASCRISAARWARNWAISRSFQRTISARNSLGRRGSTCNQARRRAWDITSIGSNIAFEGMQPALMQSDARSALWPIKKRTFAPNSCAVRAAVNPAEPPPMTAIVFCFMTSRPLFFSEHHARFLSPKLSR